MTSSPSEEFVIDPSAIKELQLIEASLSDVDTEITAKQYLMTKDILAARQSTIAKIPGFWAVVFDHASSELEAAITGSDLAVFANALQGIEIGRPEVPASAHAAQVGLAHFGEPRSVTIRFHWSENAWFSDSILEKTFFYRHGKDGSAGLVSDPVRIHWKDGKDLTEGLTDAAYHFWAAQKAQPAQQQLDAVLVGDARKARDAEARKMPEYKALADKLENATNGAVSFFNFFSYRGRWTSAAESVEAKAELLAKRQAALNGTAAEDDDDDEEDEDFPEEDVETFPAGHEVAVSIAEDIFPSAIDYFMADTIDSDDELDGIEIDNTDDDDEDDDDVEMS